MKNILLMAVLLSLWSCGEDELQLGPAATIHLNFHATFGGEPFILNKPYNFDGKKIKFDELSFFVANVTLLEENTTDELDLIEVNLMNFAGNISEAKPFTFTRPLIPAVAYKGIRLSIGVPSRFNRSAVLNQGDGHPVKNAYGTHFWEKGSSFYFMKLSGMYDLNNDGAFTGKPDDHPFQHFPVGNSNFVTFTIPKNFTIENGKPFHLNLELDVKKLYDNNGHLLDLSKPELLSTIDPENKTLSKQLMNNFLIALTAR